MIAPPCPHHTPLFAHVEPGCSTSTTRSTRVSLNLWQQVDERIRDYIANFLKIRQRRAFRVQKDYTSATAPRCADDDRARDEPGRLLAFVHKIDHSPLEPNPALGAAIEKLPGRKLISPTVRASTPTP
jgi:putative hydrolase of the HAD superfamily